MAAPTVENKDSRESAVAAANDAVQRPRATDHETSSSRTSSPFATPTPASTASPQPLHHSTTYDGTSYVGASTQFSATHARHPARASTSRPSYRRKLSRRSRENGFLLQSHGLPLTYLFLTCLRQLSVLIDQDTCPQPSHLKPGVKMDGCTGDCWRESSQPHAKPRFQPKGVWIWQRFSMRCLQKVTIAMELPRIPSGFSQSHKLRGIGWLEPPANFT